MLRPRFECLFTMTLRLGVLNEQTGKYDTMIKLRLKAGGN